jgi:hypothetical protein
MISEVMPYQKRFLEVSGQPADVCEIVASYGRWLAARRGAERGCGRTNREATERAVVTATLACPLFGRRARWRGPARRVR